MKKLFYLIAIGSFFLLASCEDDSTNNIVNSNDVVETAQTGSLSISYYNDSGDDETYHYVGYSFSFADGGVLSAQKGDQTITGTWSVGTDDSTTKFIINFSAPEIFEELSDDWHVVERTESIIKLEDVSGGDGSVDYLTFVRS